jgi:ubiquinone/menaquinone biosynthesis C-methylase UbiE
MTEPGDDGDSVRRGYSLERSPAETARLGLQERLIGATTPRLLIEAGISPGMRVLDIGSGAGDVSISLARIVGPTGSVVGVEVDGPSVQTA